MSKKASRRCLNTSMYVDGVKVDLRSNDVYITLPYSAVPLKVVTRRKDHVPASEGGATIHVRDLERLRSSCEVSVFARGSGRSTPLFSTVMDSAQVLGRSGRRVGVSVYKFDRLGSEAALVALAAPGASVAQLRAASVHLTRAGRWEDAAGVLAARMSDLRAGARGEGGVFTIRAEQVESSEGFSALQDELAHVLATAALGVLDPSSPTDLASSAREGFSKLARKHPWLRARPSDHSPLGGLAGPVSVLDPSFADELASSRYHFGASWDRAAALPTFEGWSASLHLAHSLSDPDAVLDVLDRVDATRSAESDPRATLARLDLSPEYAEMKSQLLRHAGAMLDQKDLYGAAWSDRDEDSHARQVRDRLGRLALQSMQDWEVLNGRRPEQATGEVYDVDDDPALADKEGIVLSGGEPRLKPASDAALLLAASALVAAHGRDDIDDLMKALDKPRDAGYWYEDTAPGIRAALALAADAHTKPLAGPVLGEVLRVFDHRQLTPDAKDMVCEVLEGLFDPETRSLPEGTPLPDFSGFHANRLLPLVSSMVDSDTSDIPPDVERLMLNMDLDKNWPTPARGAADLISRVLSRRPQDLSSASALIGKLHRHDPSAASEALRSGLHSVREAGSTDGFRSLLEGITDGPASAIMQEIMQDRSMQAEVLSSVADFSRGFPQDRQHPFGSYEEDGAMLDAVVDRVDDPRTFLASPPFMGLLRDAQEGSELSLVMAEDLGFEAPHGSITAEGRRRAYRALSAVGKRAALLALDSSGPQARDLSAMSSSGAHDRLEAYGEEAREVNAKARILRDMYLRSLPDHEAVISELEDAGGRERGSSSVYPTYASGASSDPASIEFLEGLIVRAVSSPDEDLPRHVDSILRALKLSLYESTYSREGGTGSKVFGLTSVAPSRTVVSLARRLASRLERYSAMMAREQALGLHGSRDRQKEVATLISALQLAGGKDADGWHPADRALLGLVHERSHTQPSLTRPLTAGMPDG